MPKTWRTTSTNLSRIFWWSSRYKSFSSARSGAHQPTGACDLAILPPAVDYSRAGIPCCCSVKWKGAAREGIIRKASRQSKVEMQTSVLLRPREPFSFTRTLRFILSPPALLNGRQFAPLLDYFEDGEYRRLADIQGQPVLYGVSERQTFPATLRGRILARP